MSAHEWTAEVSAAYAQRGLGGRLQPGACPAVVVVDLIRGFTDPTFPAGSNLDDVVAASAQVLASARKAGVPVVFTTIAFSAALVRGHIWLQKMPAMCGLLEGTPWVEVDPRLSPRSDEPVLVKRGASAFFGTDLSTFLSSRNADSVIVLGATTSGCVRATAVDACMLGWPTFVPRECVGDRAQGPHDANLFDIQAKYGEVITLTEALRMLNSSRARP